MSVSNLVINLFSSIFAHLHIPILLSVSFRWRRKRILMKEITRHLFIFLTHKGLTILIINQNKATTAKRINGRNNLKTAFELKGPLISKSVMKQSNERKVSDNSLTFSQV